MNTQEMIKVMQHFADGGAIEYRNKGCTQWAPMKDPAWVWNTVEYRIARKTTKIHLYGWLVEGEAKLLESCVSPTGAIRLPQLDRVLEVEL